MNIGIMQGRLSPRYLGRYQAHPLGYWQAEFHIAKTLGFSAIEWIIDFNDIDLNPMMSAAGIDDILAQVTQTGVSVQSICADFLMEAPLHSLHQTQSEESLAHLFPLAKKVGVTDIIIPCVDQSRLNSEADHTQLCQSLEKLLPLAEQNGIVLNLETDLAPAPFLRLVQSLAHSAIAINYDTGNSASLGFDPKEELATYGDKISIIHIKDRVLGGGSVPLGTGSTNFVPILEFIKTKKQSHIITMQAARETEFVDDLVGVSAQKRRLDTWIQR